MTVSVIIPACNAESSLGRCLDSVLAQTLAPREIVVINDGSTDDTAAVARGFGDRILYREQANAGQGAARNAGLAVASGRFVAFLDADDYWKPGFLEASVSFLTRRPEAIAVSCAFLTRFTDGSETVGPACVADRSGPREPVLLDDFYRFWGEQDHVRTGTVLVRREVIEKAGGQCPELRVSQDLEYWGYLGTFGPWGFIPEPLWVGNSRAAAQAGGWLAKYRQRRRLCPTVEAWQRRILPRLTPAQLPHFKGVRGRVAAGYAQNHILGGNPAQARHIIRTYGPEMPHNRLTRLLKAGHRLGAPGWRLACGIVMAREYAKAAALTAHGRSEMESRLSGINTKRFD